MVTNKDALNFCHIGFYLIANSKISSGGNVPTTRDVAVFHSLSFTRCCHHRPSKKQCGLNWLCKIRIPMARDHHYSKKSRLTRRQQSIRKSSPPRAPSSTVSHGSKVPNLGVYERLEDTTKAFDLLPLNTVQYTNPR